MPVINFGVDHPALATMKENMDDKLRDALEEMLAMRASNAVITVKLEITRTTGSERPVAGKVEYFNSLFFAHDCNYRIVFEDKTKGHSNDWYRVMQNGAVVNLVRPDDPQISMFESEEELDE